MVRRVRQDRRDLVAAEIPDLEGQKLDLCTVVFVEPRNAYLPRDYTGCRSIWVMDSPDHMPLYVRLYFEEGRLRLAHTFGRDGAPDATCDLRSPGSSCAGIEDSELAALHLPTWPRVCAEHADLPACQRKPD